MFYYKSTNLMSIYVAPSDSTSFGQSRGYSGYVYFLEFKKFEGYTGRFKRYKSFIKIGYSTNVKKRLSAHNSYYPGFKLVYLEYSERPDVLERIYHRKFNKYRRYSGTRERKEEFIYTGELRDFILTKNPTELCFRECFNVTKNNNIYEIDTKHPLLYEMYLDSEISNVKESDFRTDISLNKNNYLNLLSKLDYGWEHYIIPIVKDRDGFYVGYIEHLSDEFQDSYIDMCLAYDAIQPSRPITKNQKIIDKNLTLVAV